MVSVKFSGRRVANGFVVEVAGEEFVATDCIDLAGVFEQVFETPEVRVELTDEGRAALERLDLRTGAEVLAAWKPKAGGTLADTPAGGNDWPFGEPPGSAPAAAAAGADEVIRAPIADDGGELPRLRKIGQKYEIECGAHDWSRAEFRDGGKALGCHVRLKGGALCSTAVPKDQVSRLLAASAA